MKVANRLLHIILVVSQILLCSAPRLQAAQSADHYQVIRDVLFPRLFVAERRDGSNEKWQQRRFVRASPNSSLLMKFNFQETDLQNLKALGKEVCIGTQVIDPVPMPSVTPSSKWKTTRLYLTIPEAQPINSPTFANPPNSRYTIRVAVSTELTGCPVGSDVVLPQVEAPVYDLQVETKDESGWKLTVTDATLLIGRTELPDLADGTDRSLQTFRVGTNAFPFAETHSLRGQRGSLQAWLGWLGVGGNLSLLDFNHDGSIEPGVGVVFAPAPLHRIIFVGVGLNLVQPSTAVFDPSQPNRLIHLENRGYVFLGVSGLSLKKWLEGKQKPASPPPATTSEQDGRRR